VFSFFSTCIVTEGTVTWFAVSQRAVLFGCNVFILISIRIVFKTEWYGLLQASSGRLLQCVAVYCGVLQCIAVYYSVLQCVAVAGLIFPFLSLSLYLSCFCSFFSTYLLAISLCISLFCRSLSFIFLLSLSLFLSRALSLSLSLPPSFFFLLRDRIWGGYE